MKMVKSASRVLDLLELFAIVPTPLGISEVARRLSLPKSSAQALLQTLAARGYLTRVGSDYELSPSLRAGGWAGGEYAQLLRVASATVEQVVKGSGESSLIGVRTPDWKIQFVCKVVSPNEVRYDVDMVAARPMYCTSTGLAILAWQEPADIDAYFEQTPLVKVTPYTVTDPATLRQLLIQIGDQGYAESFDAHILGASGAAAPIFGPSGRVIAALNIGAPSERYALGREAIIHQVVDGAAKITRQLKALA